jgi:hypothetical protein
MAFDTFIMIACLFGLWRSKPRGGGRADDLYRLLWTDGLSYFIIASAANALPGELGVLTTRQFAHLLASVVFFGLSLNGTCTTAWSFIHLIRIAIQLRWT